VGLKSLQPFFFSSHLKEKTEQNLESRDIREMHRTTKKKVKKEPTKKNTKKKHNKKKKKSD